jgi:ABC-type lipoprotein release transport system permease subunit
MFSGFITLVSIALLLFLYGNNVRERRGEVAILRALGISVSSVHSLFMAKALILAFIGSFAGSCTGIVTASVLSANARSIQLSNLLILAATIILAACFLSLMACWLPTRNAAARDPGLVLNEN